MASPAINFDVTNSGDVYSSDPFSNVWDTVPGMDLPGQLDGVPGGGASDGSWYSSDPSGINVIYNDPSVNPNGTGGWQSIAQSILQLGTQAFLVFNRGTPSVATPPPRPAGTGIAPGLYQGASGGQPAKLFGFPLQTVVLIALGAVGLIWVAKTI